MSNLSTIAKIIARKNPSVFTEAKQLCEPMLKNPRFLPEIHKRIKEIYPDIDRTDESILFAAVAYQAYAPATLIDKGIQRAPNGIRKVMCEVMSWNNATVCNNYNSIARAYIKGVSYQDKVNAVLLGFEKFSVKSNQISLL